MKTFTIEDIRDWEPCYDPGTLLPENWSGTALDILRLEEMPCENRLWVVLRPEILDDKTLRWFAIWCARRSQPWLTDPRSINAIDVAEKFASGNATEEELVAARRYAFAAWKATKKEEFVSGAKVSAAEAALAAVAARPGAEKWRRGASPTAQVAHLIKMLELA